MTPLTDLSEMLRALEPELHDGVYVFAVSGIDRATPAGAIATFREKEGLTVILEESRAIKLGLPVLLRASWITLNVYSDLEAVGLTAAVSNALAAAAISCNLIAAASHDHLFVPVADGERALDILRSLQNRAAAEVARSEPKPSSPNS